jgi:lipoprotein-anchoring transpeptidase ErfK/SrfK
MLVHHTECYKERYARNGSPENKTTLKYMLLTEVKGTAQTLSISIGRKV